jgi:hypothetical protein
MSPQYIAGLVDGEGYLAIMPCKDKKNCINPSFQCVFKLTLTGYAAQEVVQEIADKYKGWVYKRNKPTATGKDVYTVEIKSKPRLKVFLADIEPYLIVKKEQAKILSEFIALPKIHPNYGNFTSELLATKSELPRRLKALTQRIPLATTE